MGHLARVLIVKGQKAMWRNPLKLSLGIFLFCYSNYEVIDFLRDRAHANQTTLINCYLLIYVIALLCCLTASFHSKLLWRIFWGVVISASTSVSLLYFWISQSRLTVFDIFASLNAVSDTGRFVGFYAKELVVAAVFFCISLSVFVLRPNALPLRMSKWLDYAVPLPLFPIFLAAFVLYDGVGATGSVPLPRQFALVPMGALIAVNANFRDDPVRRDVAWTPGKPIAHGSIVYLVDESIRGDYIDFSPGNPYTPNIARLADQFINFGPASSAGNCSNYSNFSLRFGVSRKDMTASIKTNATIFAYAKKAGYRTVYINGQAGGYWGGIKLVNFMTVQEQSFIDQVYLVDEVPARVADQELGKIIAQELKSGVPVFIYANKNGSHFFYDDAYPSSAAIFHPTLTESQVDTQAALIASYRNSIAWATDRFMGDLFSDDSLKNATLIYTSDHGQQLIPGRLTHCQAEGAVQQMHVVPLMVHTNDPDLKQKLQRGADLLRNKASHFQIAPAIYYFMGYKPEDIATRYDESLLTGTSRPAETTSGDMFGLLSSKMHWNLVDLTQNMMEQQGLSSRVVSQ